MGKVRFALVFVIDYDWLLRAHEQISWIFKDRAIFT